MSSRFSLALLIFSLNCGSVSLKNRNMRGDSPDSGSADTGSYQDSVSPDTIASTDVIVAIDTSNTVDLSQDSNVESTTNQDTGLVDSGSESRPQNTCPATCQLNCVNTAEPLGSEKQFTSCDGCISNCPVHGLKLLCVCHNGCGYDQVQGTCNEM